MERLPACEADPIVRVPSPVLLVDGPSSVWRSIVLPGWMVPGLPGKQPSQLRLSNIVRIDFVSQNLAISGSCGLAGR